MGTSSKQEERLFKSFCNACMRQTKHLLIYSHSQSGSDEDEPSLSWENAYQILECQGCENVTYRTRQWFSEWVDESGANYQYSYYPPLVSRQKPKWAESLPKSIRSVLDEVYISLDA